MFKPKYGQYAWIFKYFLYILGFVPILALYWAVTLCCYTRQKCEAPWNHDPRPGLFILLSYLCFLDNPTVTYELFRAKKWSDFYT